MRILQAQCVRLGLLAFLLFASLPARASAATVTVCAAGCTYTDLQRAIDDARPGDVILLRGGETYVGHFVLRRKDDSSGNPIIIRSSSPGAELPGPGVRLVPDGYPGANVARSALARLIGRGGQWKTTPVIAAEPSAGDYRLELLDIDGIQQEGYYTLVEIGTNDSRQPTLASVPHNIVLDRVFVHGHPTKGQQRCIGLNGRNVDVINSFVVSCSSFAVDAQAISTFNGPGPIKIVNNYLEATTENVMIGGADPRIQGLVPSDIEISRNHFRKPLSWKYPILEAPAGAPSASGQGGGSLPGGTYYFKVVALLDAGSDLAFSVPSPERAAGVPGGGQVAVSWAAVEGADRYRVYAGTSSGGQNRYMETSGPATSLAYTGVGEVWEAPPAGGTLWNVKNLLEFKNAQRVKIDGNVFEHMWPASQSGYAILITPRNEEGTAPWSVVQDITMTNNIVRHASGVLNILGRDDIQSSQQTSRIIFRNNLVYDISSAWGGSSHFAVITRSPASLTFDHNTIFTEGMLVLADDGVSYGLTFTNNVAVHNDYGFYGSGAGIGSAALQVYFPDPVFRRNAFGGGPAAAYPADNFFPDMATFRSQFVNMDGADFNLVAGSIFRGKGTDGKDLGVDYAALSAATAGVISGSPTGGGTGGSGGGGDTGGGSTPGNPGGGVSVPYGAPIALPGTIEAENFDNGGSGVAYHDESGGNSGGQYRTVDVDIESTSDANGGYNLGWISAGEWLRYSVSVASAGTYDLQFRVASSGQGGTFHVEANGVNLTGPIAIPDTGGWQSWVTVTKTGVTLAAGAQVWTVVVDGATAGVVGNLNYIRVVSAGSGGGTTSPTTPYTGLAAALPGTVQAEDFDNGPSGQAYRDTSGGNSGGAYRSTDVDIETTADAFGGHNIGWAGAGEFLQYTVAMAAAGTYDLEFRVASAGGGGSFHLEVNGSNVTGPVVVPDTGGWQTWTTVKKTGVTLNAGQQVWRLVLDTDGGNGAVGNINWIRVSAGSGGGSTPPAPSGGDIVLHAADVSATSGNWARVGSSSGAGGEKMQSQDWGWSNTDRAQADPEHYFEARFVPEVNRLYRVWVRLRAGGDSKWNDSLWLQFSDARSATGSGLWRIGTEGALLVNLETCAGCGVSDWGWAGAAWWTGDSPIVQFTSGAEQRLRVQIREDGVEVDQIVLSPVTYFDRAPGAAANDSTIVPKR